MELLNIKNFWNDEDKKNLILIALSGMFIRFWGITYGLPAVYNSTEYFSAQHALSFGARKALEPLFFIYPTLYTYFIAALFAGYFLIGFAIGWFSGTEDFAFQFLTNPSNFYMIGRLANGLMIIVAAMILYKTVRFFVTTGISLIISLIFLTSINLHEFTFWMVPDAALILGSVIVIYFLVKLREQDLTNRNLFFASFICGLTISVKYNAGFLALSWLLAIWLFGSWDLRKRFQRSLMGVGGIVFGFFMGTPYWLISFTKFWNGFKMISSQARYSYNFESGLPYIWEILKFLETEWLLGGLIAGLMILAILRINKNVIPFLGLIFPTFLYVGSWQKKGLDYLLIILPVLLVYLAIEIKQFAWLKKNEKIVVSVGLIILLMNVPRVLYRDYLRSKPDTRQQASQWIKENLPPGSPICYDHYHYDLHLIDINRFTQYGQGSRYLSNGIKKKLENYENLATNYQFVSSQIKIDRPVLAENLLNIVQSDSFLWEAYTNPHKALTEIVKEGAELLILNSETYQKYLHNRIPSQDNPMRTDFLQRRVFYELVSVSLSEKVVFRPDWNTSGPIIKIYDLRELSNESPNRN
jgi:hypothetical protein